LFLDGALFSLQVLSPFFYLLGLLRSGRTRLGGFIQVDVQAQLAVDLLLDISSQYICTIHNTSYLIADLIADPLYLLFEEGHPLLLEEGPLGGRRR
jgi:hypothetical protein